MVMARRDSLLQSAYAEAVKHDLALHIVVDIEGALALDISIKAIAQGIQTIMDKYAVCKKFMLTLYAYIIDPFYDFPT